MKNILVIGGSYFTGRVFTILATGRGDRITMINRGKFSMKSYPGVKEFACDRHDLAKLKTLPLDEHYDAIVDFCAYRPGDIKDLLDSISLTFDRYIFISTADVAKPSVGVRTVHSPLVTEGGGPVGDYVYGKRLLEEELMRCAEEKGFPYTILRPAFIYGLFNYAPREQVFIEQIYRRKEVEIPSDASGRFQMIYVGDVGRIILTVIDKEDKLSRTLILAAKEVFGYRSFINTLIAASGLTVKVIETPLAQMMQKKARLPYPLYETENELFDGSEVTRIYGYSYEEAISGLDKTFEALKDVYS